MASQSETLLNPSPIHPSGRVCLTPPEPAPILIDDSDSEDSTNEHETERTQINTRRRKRQREDELETRRKRLRTSRASAASNASEEDVIDLTSESDVIDVERAESASRGDATPLYDISDPNIRRTFTMATALSLFFNTLPSSVFETGTDTDHGAMFGGGYWSRRRQQRSQLSRSSSSTGSVSRQVVDVDSEEPASTSQSGAKSPDKSNASMDNKPAGVREATKDLKCAICLGSIENITATVCGHIFCEGCILSAIEMQRKCPICRTYLTKKSIHPLFL